VFNSEKTRASVHAPGGVAFFYLVIIKSMTHTHVQVNSWYQSVESLSLSLSFVLSLSQACLFVKETDNS
jgi:hypothetical protein